MPRVEPESTPDDKKAALSRFSDALEAFLPASLQNAEIEERGRARILVGFTVILCGVSIVIVAVQVLIGTPAGVMLGCAVGISQILILIGIRAGCPTRLMSQILIGSIFTFSVGIMIGSAARASTAVVVASLLPLVSLLIVGSRAAIGWTLATLCGVGVAAIYASSTTDYFYSGPILVWEQTRFLTTSATVLFVLAATMILERARALALREARSAKNQLEKRDALYRSVVENLGDLLMDFDEKGNCEYIGPNCVEVLGHEASEFLGKKYIALVHPDDADDLRELYRFSMAHPGATRALALRVRRKADDWAHVQLSSRCYVDKSGRLHFTAIARDTTNLWLAEMTARHNERLKTAGTLSAGIAHQINNPIGSILNASQFALISLEDGDLKSVRLALQDNIDQATRCGEIVRSLLHFASRENPKTGREDLLQIIHRSREFTISYAGQQSIEIEVSGHLEPLWVDVSSIEIEQVLINLLRNAIESGPDSNQIEVVVSASESHARIEVRDDGCGIDKSDRDQIFDPFYTTRIREGGSGLGLSVAHGIIRDHGGSMDVESGADRGTCIGVELPLADH